MVITVEPGLYIPHNRANVDRDWWGTAVRIEDDILITEDGVEILSRACPKTVSEISELIR